MGKQLILILLLFLYQPFFTFAANPNDIIITEIMYDFDGADEDRERVEIYNPTDVPIDLTDWRFNDGVNHILNIPPIN